MNPWFIRCFACCLFWTAALQAREALLIDLQGPIGPASSAFVRSAIQQAEQRKAAALVLRLDTPGGLDSAMREIIRAITQASVPILCFVAPSGARAASAGTYILYACPIAAMAPGTNLGAATPIQIGGRSPSDGEKQALPKQRKLINDAVAYLRGLAQLRGRNGDWAERAVREAASLPAREALKLGVIDLMASDVSDLLGKVDGRKVQMPTGEQTLWTLGLDLVPLEPDWQNRFLQVISNPNLAYLLLLLGIYGLVYEFSNPGTVLPGTLGVVSLLLGLYAFQLLPIHYTGLALLLLGLALLVAEAFVPSFGALGIAGLALFILGSLMLLDSRAPGFQLSRALILGLAGTSALFLIPVVHLALRARHRPVISGAEGLRAAEGITLDAFPGRGRVRIQGEIWEAQSEVPIQVGQAVRVIDRQGLQLKIVPKAEENP